MVQDQPDLAVMAEALSRSADYRVLRRLVPRPPCQAPAGCETRSAVLLDTETTGLDHARDEIIELGMIKFDYTADGRIAGVRDSFSAFNEPSAPISAEVTALTGITDGMVAGHRIDEAAVNAFVEDAVIVIAHNSGFLPAARSRIFPPGPQGRRRLPCIAGDPGLHVADDRRAGARAAARDRPQADVADLGGNRPHSNSRTR
jgi:DNA polymerase-3 subunit epsilon